MSREKKASDAKARIAVPSLVWLLLAVASFVAAFGAWQSQRLDRMRPPPSVAPAAVTSNGAEPPAPAQPTSQAPAGAAPGGAPGAASLAGVEEAGSAPLRQLDPQAGRQVLRCISKGRVTYRDLNAGCPEGAAERVTVFPTEGVGKPQ